MSLPVALLLAVQVAQSGVSGSVRDELTGAPLADAVVALPDLDRSVRTDAAGRFLFLDLAPGPHHLTVARHGFAPRTVHALVPRGSVLELTLALEPVPLELEGLVVEPRLSIRGADPPGPATGLPGPVTIAAVRNHPLLAEPDVFRALEGVDATSLPEAHAGLHLRGGAAGHTGYEIDGIPVLGPVHAAGLFSAWDPDVLSSVRWSRSSASVVPSLSGTVSAITRSPGGVTRARSVLSTTQARASTEGPLGAGGAGYVVSARHGFAGPLAATRDPAKIGGEAGDVLGKVELPLAGGEVEILAYASENEISTGVVADARPGQDIPGRNGFEWKTQAVGAAWTRVRGPTTLGLRAWDSRASGHVSVGEATGGRLEGTNRRSERGVAADLTRGRPSGRALRVGLRLTGGETRYAGAAPEAFERAGGVTAAALLVGLGVSPTPSSRILAEVDASASELGPTLSPRLVVSAEPSPTVTVTASVSRRHQLTQSLRNEESLLGTVFPTELHVSAGSPGVPVARADEVDARVEYRPLPGVTLGGQAYLRRLDSVVFVAPTTGSLLTSGPPEVGSARVRAVALDAALSGARYGIVADVTAERVRNRVPGRTWTPSYAPALRAQAGVVVYVTPTLALRVAETAMWGRRSTALLGPVEWEACNLADGGCELAGDARHGDALGALRPGAYARTDVGLRKHWHLALAGRDARLALYGTVTNVLGRPNTLTYALDPTTGGLDRVDMLPPAPLVVGLELVF